MQFAGPLAGKCETIAAAGFMQAHQDEKLCSRCSSKGSYGKMFSETNGMHLGPRHTALSELTWYEALLIGRVHPMVSVLTLAATGQLVYAAHVVNYQQKVLELVCELPAMLNDKGCLLIKRRKCLTQTPSEARQKKPITANRQRIISAIKQCRLSMPKVYEGSVDSQENLERIPLIGEMEMPEQKESVELDGEIHIDIETFTAWVACATNCLCAKILWVYARDAQAEMRSTFGPDTAWELYQGMLEHKGLKQISSRMFAGLLHEILEKGSAHEELKDRAYTGVLEDLANRGKELLAADDEPLMKMRWLRLTIHKEIDVVRATLEAKGEQVPLTLDVNGTVAEPEQGSLLEEVEQKATSHIHALAEARRTELGELLNAAVAAIDYARAAELQKELQDLEGPCQREQVVVLFVYHFRLPDS